MLPLVAGTRTSPLFEAGVSIQLITNGVTSAARKLNLSFEVFVPTATVAVATAENAGWLAHVRASSFQSAPVTWRISNDPFVVILSTKTVRVAFDTCALVVPAGKLFRLNLRKVRKTGLLADWTARLLFAPLMSFT